MGQHLCADSCELKMAALHMPPTHSSDRSVHWDLSLSARQISVPGAAPELRLRLVTCTPPPHENNNTRHHVRDATCQHDTTFALR